MTHGFGANRHDGLLAHPNLVSAAIIGFGLFAVAIALVLRDQVGVYDLAGPLKAAGVFVFLGLAYLAITHLARMHMQADERLDAAISHAEKAAREAEVAEGRRPASRH